MKKTVITESTAWLSSQLARFGFDDDWESWIDRIREIESPIAFGSIGPYEILNEVARGGQGIVYKARLAETGQILALKRLIAGTYASADSRKRLERELVATASLN